MNNLLKEYSEKNNFYFLDIYDNYSEDNGTLKYELSDKCVHIEKNEYIHYKLLELL